MNQKQIEYTMKRIASIQKDKLNQAEKQYQIPAKHLTDIERIDLIRKGKVSLKSKKDLDNQRNWLNHIKTVFDFSAYEHPASYIQPDYDNRMKVINDKATKLRDQVMLGDSEEALKLISEFESM